VPTNERENSDIFENREIGDHVVNGGGKRISRAFPLGNGLLQGNAYTGQAMDHDIKFPLVKATIETIKYFV
jgi:hypothetical protein